MTEEKKISVLELEKLVNEEESILEIHPDGTVTSFELSGPPRRLLTYHLDAGATY